MTYKEFMTGLYWKYHMVYVRSVPFVKFGEASKESAGFEDRIIAKVDSERMLAKIKNRNMAEALCLIAQGYMEWEVGIMLGLKYQTTRRYVWEFKKILKKDFNTSGR